MRQAVERLPEGVNVDWRQGRVAALHEVGDMNDEVTV